jgi:short-subunit dehydrogenase
MSKTALVTGASSGIGKEIAKQLIADGHAVYVAARRVESMRDLEALGATPLALDITRDADVVRVVERIKAERGGVDILVNNAGFGMYGAVEDTSIDDARYQFEVNIFGLARLTQLVLPHMRAAGGGKIVNISSMGGKIYTPLGAWYHATKHALEGWSDCLRLELAPFNIDVIIIEPGAIQTEFGDVLTGPMLARSGETAYAELAHKVAAGVKASYAAGAGSPASLIAQVVSRSLKTKRPRTRYAAGKYAVPMIAARRWLSDRAFDKAVMSQF